MTWPYHINFWNLATIGIGSLLASCAFRSLWKTSKQTIKTHNLLLDIAKKAICVDPSRVEETNEGKIVHVVGRLLAGKKISDPYFSDFEIPFVLFLKRVIEMYQWSEEKFVFCPHMVYFYVKKWHEVLALGRIQSENFKYKAQERTNPSSPLSTLIVAASPITLGGYELSEEVMGEIPGSYKFYQSPKFHSDNENWSYLRQNGHMLAHYENENSKNSENSTNSQYLEDSKNSENSKNSEYLENSKNSENLENSKNSEKLENSKTKNSENSILELFSETHETNSVNVTRDSQITKSPVDGVLRKEKFQENDSVDKIGDLRVKFQVIEEGTVSVLAKQEGNKLVPFSIQNGKSLSLVAWGDKSIHDICQIHRNALTLSHSLQFYFGTFLAIMGAYLVTSSMIKFMPTLHKIGGQGLLCSFSLGTTLSAWVVGTAWFPYDPFFSIRLYGLGTLVSGVFFSHVINN